MSRLPQQAARGDCKNQFGLAILSWGVVLTPTVKFQVLSVWAKVARSPKRDIGRHFVRQRL